MKRTCKCNSPPQRSLGIGMDFHSLISSAKGAADRAAKGAADRAAKFTSLVRARD